MIGVPFSEPPGVPGGVLVVVIVGPLERRLCSADRFESSFPAFSSIAVWLNSESASVVV